MFQRIHIKQHERGLRFRKGDFQDLVGPGSYKRALVQRLWYEAVRGEKLEILSTLDALLTDKEAVGAEVRAALAKRAGSFGVEVRSVGLRDLILPGEIKTILNQVITAQKQAEANVIKRREETAAARSQANTAKLLADNPALARLKELELLQAILAGARTAFVFGRGDLATQVRSLIDRDG